MAMKCPLCDTVLQGRGVFITNPRHISFVQKMFPDFRPQEKVCRKCKKDMETTYDYKYKRALALRAKKRPFIESSSSEEPPGQNQTNTPSTQSSEDSNRPTTSAQAAEKRKRLQENQRRKNAQNTSGINVIRGVRLPHITPAPKRQQFVHINPDIMDIYLKGIRGG